MAVGKTLYNMFFRRTSTFFATIVVGAVLFERAFDQGADRLWERMNKGVSVFHCMVWTSYNVTIFYPEIMERPPRED